MKTFLTEVVSRAALSACMMISTSGNRIADAPRETPQIIVGSERRRTRAVTQTDQLERRVAAECAVIVLGLVVGLNALDPLTDHRQIRVQHLASARRSMPPQTARSIESPHQTAGSATAPPRPSTASEKPRLRSAAPPRNRGQTATHPATPTRPPRGVEVLISQSLLRQWWPFHWCCMNNAG